MLVLVARNLKCNKACFCNWVHFCNILSTAETTVWDSNETFVMVVPATGVVLLYSDGSWVDTEQTVNTMQLPPRQWVTQHFTCFLDVKLTSSQESQYVTVLWYLHHCHLNKRNRCIILPTDIILKLPAILHRVYKEINQIQINTTKLYMHNISSSPGKNAIQ